MALLRARRGRRSGDPLRRPARSRAHPGETVAAALAAAGITGLAHDPPRRTARAVLRHGRLPGLPRHDRRPPEPARLHGEDHGPHEVRSQVALPRLAIDGDAGPVPGSPRSGRGARGRRRCRRLDRRRGRGRGGSPGRAGGRAADARVASTTSSRPGRRPGTMPQFAGGRRLIGPSAGGRRPVRRRCGVERVAAAAGRGLRRRRCTDIPAATADRRDRRLRAPAAGAWLDAAGRDDHRRRCRPCFAATGSCPDRRILIAGNGPLNLQVACELRRAGAEIVAVAEAARRPGAWALAHLAAMARASPGLTRQGCRLSASSWPGTAYRCAGARRLAAVVAEGEVLAARLDDGSTWRADIVAMGYGFLPANELLRLLGCRHRYDPERGHLVTERDGSCRTSVPDVLAVGDCCGLGGARAAEAEGAIAGAVAVGRRGPIRARCVALARHRRFQAGLWRLFTAPRRQVCAWPHRTR